MSESNHETKPEQANHAAPRDGSRPTTGAETPIVARLFVVPLLIVIMIVASSVAVVLLFGAITSEEERSLDDLVKALEQSAGRASSLGVLWPKEKEYYHAERELLLRLQDKDNAVPKEDRPELAKRLAEVLRRVIAAPPTERGLSNERCLMHALGLLEEPAGVDVLLKALEDRGVPAPAEPIAGSPVATSSRDVTSRRQFAAEGLAMLRRVPQTRRAVEPLSKIVSSSGEPQPLRLVASVALSVLAKSGDAGAIAALKDAYFADDRELKWNAAMGLARLGDATGASLLREMLQRSYWEQPGLVHVTAEDGSPLAGPDGNPVTRDLTEVQVAGYLQAAIEAAAPLDVPKLDEAIRVLKNDPSAEVRQAATAALSADERAIAAGDESDATFR